MTGIEGPLDPQEEAEEVESEFGRSGVDLGMTEFDLGDLDDIFNGLKITKEGMDDLILNSQESQDQSVIECGFRSSWNDRKGLCSRCPKNNIKKDGKCQKCSNYTVPNSRGDECERPSCKDSQYLKRDGTCSKCPSFTTINEDGLSCSQPKCRNREKLLANGKCKSCLMYTKRSKNKRECVRESCNKISIVGPLGNCFKCPLYTRA